MMTFNNQSPPVTMVKNMPEAEIISEYIFAYEYL